MRFGVGGRSDDASAVRRAIHRRRGPFWQRFCEVGASARTKVYERFELQPSPRSPRMSTQGLSTQAQQQLRLRRPRRAPVDAAGLFGLLVLRLRRGCAGLRRPGRRRPVHGPAAPLGRRVEGRGRFREAGHGPLLRDRRASRVWYVFERRRGDGVEAPRRH